MNDLDKLKLELICRFADLTEEQIIDYRHLWNYNALVGNPNIKWSIELLKELRNEFDWSYAYRLLELKSDVSFLEEFEDNIDFDNILLLKPKKPWPIIFILKNEHRFRPYLLIMNAPSVNYATEFLRKYKHQLDKWEWGKLLRHQEFDFNEDFISELIDENDWLELSYNPFFNRNFNLLLKYQDKVSWDAVSSSIRDLGVLLFNHDFEKWDWKRITRNLNFIPVILGIPEFNKIVWEEVPRNRFLPGDRKSIAQILKSYLRLIDSSEKHSKEYFFWNIFFYQAINAQEVYSLIKSSGKSQDLIDYLASKGAFRNIKLESDDFNKWFKNLKHDDSTFVYLNSDNYNDELIEEHIEFVKDTLSEIKSSKMSVSIPLSKEIIKKYNLAVDISNQLKFSSYTWEWEEIKFLLEKWSVSYLGTRKILFDQLMMDVNLNSYLNTLDKGINHATMEHQNDDLETIKFAKDFCDEAINKFVEGDFQGAKELYTKAISSDPGIFLGYSGRGLCFYFEDNYDSAIDDFNRALSIEENCSVLFYRGECYFEKKEFALALEDYSKAIEINPSDYNYFFRRGLTYAKCGEHSRAINDFTESINICPEPKTYRNRSLSYKEIGDKENSNKDRMSAMTMISPFEDPILMHNLSLPISRDKYLRFLDQSGIKPIVRKIGKVEVVSFSHEILSIEANGLLDVKFVKIVLGFDGNNMLLSQKINFVDLASHLILEELGECHFLLRLFLNRPDWILIRHEEDPKSKRSDPRVNKYLLENESKGLLLRYDQGDSISIAINTSKQYWMKDPMFWMSWGREIR